MAANLNNPNHTNTFEGGMYKDSHPLNQPQGTYTDAKNIQLISHDGKNFTIQDALGNRKIFSIDPPYTSASPVTSDVDPMPIGFISFVDKLIVFSTNDETDPGGYGEIGVLYFKNFGQSVDYEAQTITVGVNTWTFNGYVPLYGHEGLAFSKMHKIEGFGFAENDVTKRIYWTDYNNQPRVLDINLPQLTNYVASGSLDTNNVQYMVLGGIVNYNGTNYGPGIGNVFTATVAGTAAYTVTSGQPLVTKYYDVSLLDFAPETSLGKIQFNSFGSGSKNCGNKMYFHRLFDSNSGIYTSWSFGMFPVHVGKDQDPTPHMNSQHYYVGAGSDTTPVNSGKSVKVDVDNIDTKYDAIELACAEFDQKNEVITQITIVVKESITGTEMTLEDTGANNYGTPTLSDITLFPANVLKCKTMSTNKNYMLVGNISERDEFDEIDFGDVVLGEQAYEMPVDGSKSDFSNYLTFAGNATAINPTVGSNPGSIRPYERWVVTDITGGVVVYNVTNYTLNDVIIGVTGVTAVTIPVGSQIRPCVSLTKYTPINTTGQRNNTIEFQTFTGWDYRNPAVAELAKGYWSDEKYRIGILFFDKRRNPFYVRWLGDYTFDDIDTKLGLLKNRGSGTDWFCLNPHLLTVSNLDIPRDVIDKIDGFSIVRAERDPVIITQGLCFQTQLETGTTPDIIHPLPLLTLNAQGHSADTTDHVYSYICPDDLVGHEPTRASAFTKTGDTFRVASWLSPLSYTGLGYLYVQYGNAATGAQTIASKLYDYVAPSATYDNESTVSVYARLNEGDKVVNFVGGKDFYNSDSWVGAPGAGTGTYNGMTGSAKVDANNLIFIGGKKIIVKTANDFNNYDQTAGYSDPAAGNGDNPYKCLVNYIVPNANQYGGVSDEAIAATTYISTGHYQEINNTVISETEALKLSLSSVVGVISVGDTINGATSLATGTVTYVSGTNVYLGSVTGTFQDGEVINDATSAATAVLDSNLEVCLFNDIWVGGGDCFTCMIDHGYGLFDSSYGPGVPFAATYGGAGYTIFFPCECNVNFNLRRGRKVSDYGMHDQTNGVTYSGGAGSGIGPEDYSYNDGYSSDGDPFAYPGLPVNYKNIGRFPYRIRFAGEKIPGELVDTFRVFLTNDYKDVDGQLGEINNLRSREGKTFYWQNKGIGYVPILERQVLSAGAGDATTLGTGGVVDRFDVISAFYGNQHQHGLTDTKDGYIWFDMRNKDIVVMSSAGGVTEITSPLGMKSFFNEIFLERVTSYYSGTLLNSPTFDITSDQPLLGTGIVGVYDPKLKVSYLTFKFKEWIQKGPMDALTTYEDYQVISKDFTIAFSHVLNKFVGFYDKMPAIWHNHNQIVLSANNPKNLDVYYASDMVLPTPVTIGDVIGVVKGEYVCIKSGSIPAYNATPNATYFTRINRTNEIYVENEEKTYSVVRQGYLYNTLYGRVVNNELSVVINPNTGWPFGVDTQLMLGNDVNYTDFEYFDGANTASDTNVKSYNRNYKLTDGGWWFNTPFSRKGRLSGLFNTAKYIKRNWTSSPVTNVGNVKILQKILSFFEIKF